MFNPIGRAILPTLFIVFTACAPESTLNDAPGLALERTEAKTPREDFVADTPLSSADRDEDGNDPALRRALQHLQDR